MACGSKISGALAQLEGVGKTDVDFKGAGENNSVVVEYDANSVSETKMIDAVNNLKGGHYEVKSVSVTHHQASDAAPAAGKEKKKEKISTIAPKLQYELPNIFSVFSRLF
jgi:copper chaperone CopZ